MSKHRNQSKKKKKEILWYAYQLITIDFEEMEKEFLLLVTAF